MRGKHLVMTTTVAFALQAPFMTWGDEAQPESHDSPAREYGADAEGAMSAGGMSRSGPRLGIDPEQYLHKDAFNAKGEKIGEVVMLVVNRTGSIEAVINVGGFPGVGEKKIVVPIEQLRSEADGVHVTTALTEDQLNRAAPYRDSDFSVFDPEEREHRSSHPQEGQ